MRTISPTTAVKYLASRVPPTRKQRTQIAELITHLVERLRIAEQRRPKRAEIAPAVSDDVLVSNIESLMEAINMGESQ